MSLSLLNLLTILFFNITIQNDKILTCYYTNWAIYRHGNAKYDAKYMYPYLCTHVIYAFANIDGKTLTPVPTDPWSDLPNGLDNFRKVTSMKNINPNLKVLLSVGGWQRQLSIFQLASSTEENRQKFARNTKKYLRDYNFDGFDVDWEYPNDKEKYTLMMKALNEEFKRDSSETYLLTAAVSAGAGTASVSYDIPNVSKYLDYINIMTYDFYGQFSRVVGHHSGLYCLNEKDQFCTDFAVKYWNKQGAPMSKLLIGIPTYAQGLKTNTRNPHVGDIKIGGTPQGNILHNSGILSYLEYCNAGYTNVWDDTQQAAHGEKPYYWLGYETTRGIREKANYVKDNGLAGMFVWTLDFDDFTGKECNNGKSPLIGAIHKELNIYPGIDWESILNTDETSTTTSSQSSNGNGGTADENNICESVGFVPLDRCTKYLNCAQIGSTGYVQKCGNGLLFDIKTNTCNWKFLVDCDIPESTMDSTSQKKTTSSTTRSKTSTTMETTTTSSSTSVPTTQPQTTTTSSSTSVPTTQPQKTTTSSSTSMPTTQPQTTTTSSSTSVPTTHPQANTSTTEETTTTKEPTTENTTSTTESSNENDVLDSDGNCKKVGYFPWNNCQKFVVCGSIGYRGYIINCPAGLLFDENAKVCNFKTSVNCNVNSEATTIQTLTTQESMTRAKSSTTEEPSTTVESSTTQEQMTKGSGGDFINSDGKCTKVGYFALNGCKKFVNCGFVGQIAYAINCPGNLIFDPKSKYCNYPNLVDCKV